MAFRWAGRGGSVPSSFSASVAAAFGIPPIRASDRVRKSSPAAASVELPNDAAPRGQEGAPTDDMGSMISGSSAR